MVNRDSDQLVLSARQHGPQIRTRWKKTQKIFGVPGRASRDMVAHDSTGVITVDNISLPSRLNFQWLFGELQRYQFHETGDHLYRAQHSAFLEFVFTCTQSPVVGEIGPQ